MLNVFEIQEQLSSKFYAPSYLSSFNSGKALKISFPRIRIERNFSKKSRTYQEGPKLMNHLKIDTIEGLKMSKLCQCLPKNNLVTKK